VILVIESSADYPSVAIVNSTNKTVEWHIESNEKQSHSEQLPIQVNEALLIVKERGYEIKALAINLGPGSYTGLRIGVSLVKGLALGLSVPVIGINGVEAMGKWMLSDNHQIQIAISMIDARRDEVYLSIHSRNGLSTPVEPFILTPHAFAFFANHLGFIGNSNEKASRILNIEPAFSVFGPYAWMYNETCCMKFNENDFLDLAYFEPQYLKEFRTTESKKFVL
jgi:tRNA threonylcarbamoyladenosine biosynthesis protein TsaB